MLPNAVFSWAATRSGLGLGDFIASLTPEREEQLLRAYNSWRTEKGLPSLETVITPPAKPKLPEKLPEKQSEDDLSVLMESVANEIEKAEAAEAAEIANTMAEIEAIDVPADEIIPGEVEKEIEEVDAAAPVLDEHTGEAIAREKTSVTAEVPIEQRIDKLPKDAPPALYEELFSSMAGDVDTLKAVTEATIRDHTRRHRGTAAQRAFLSWLEEHVSPQPE